MKIEDIKVGNIYEAVRNPEHRIRVHEIIGDAVYYGRTKHNRTEYGIGLQFFLKYYRQIYTIEGFEV